MIERVYTLRMEDDLGTLALEENLHTFRIADVQPTQKNKEDSSLPSVSSCCK